MMESVNIRLDSSYCLKVWSNSDISVSSFLPYSFLNIVINSWSKLSVCLCIQVCSCRPSPSSSSSLASWSIPSWFRRFPGPKSVFPFTCSSWSSSSSSVWRCWWWPCLKVSLWQSPSRWHIQWRSVGVQNYTALQPEPMQSDFLFVSVFSSDFIIS